MLADGFPLHHRQAAHDLDSAGSVFSFSPFRRR
jgi:hypothetical protein